ncbi:hypothetical protein HY950_01770 [Candidatus Gottesmanbacteria bacterium]|nr:hypothetical protein [Candidatus Gottesmanbacteria bacterium]
MIFPLFVILLIGIIYRAWFTLVPLSSGDWPFLFVENIREFSWLPEIRFLWLAPYYQIVTKIVVQYLRVPWEITEKLFWFLPFIVLSFVSSYKLTKSALGSLIYTTNTYILMIVGGGQMGVALAYALAPLVLKKYTVHSTQYTALIANGLLLATQVMFDPRIALLTILAVLLYQIVVGKSSIKNLFLSLGVPILFTTILHLYWLIPLITNPSVVGRQIGEATSAAVEYLSFASFSQTLSLLHPNWPENIFGKIYFMRPEFLVLPLIAFGSLLFLKNSKQNRTTLFFVFLALLGAFLAKGASEPFGEVYIWLFNHVPGFALFRDPTKFYLYVALAFSMLIPFSLERVNKVKMVSLLFVIFWAFTIREALLGQLTGTFKPMTVPQEYIRLKDFLYRQPEQFQTLWVPERQRFGFRSLLHPALDARLVSKQSSISGILAWITREDTKKELDALQVRYVVVPSDVRGELFLTDRTYDEVLYNEAIQALDSLSWLKRISAFAPVILYENTR